MDFSVRPERRVFHLDSECYIIYLGKDQDDYKPFLRIGNTEQLPQEVKALISPIVVTDTLTGSPILERDNLSSIVGDDFQYIGDPATVDRFKQFLKHQEFPSQAFEQTASDEMADMGVFVYFYHDGNIRVTFDKTPIFNLRRREEDDRHYLQRVKTIKNHMVRNPLRYAAREFEKAGFFILKNRTYFFSRGSIVAFDIPSDYFGDFAVAGIDPDRVTTVYAPDVSEGLIRLFKRIRAKNGRVHVITDNPPAVQGIVELFRAEQQLQLKSEVVKLHPDRFTPALDYRIRKTARHFVVESDSLPTALYVDSDLGAVVRNVLSISSAKRGWMYGSETGAQRGALLDGVPHILFQGLPKLTGTDSQKYLPAKLYGLEDMMSAAEVAAFTSVRTFFTDYYGGVGDLAGHTKKVRAARKQGTPVSAVWWVLGQTSAQIARAAAALESSDKQKKLLEGLVEALALDQAPPMAPPPSLVCDLYVHDSGAFPLYRFSESVTPDRIRQAESISASVRNEEQPQEAAWFQKEEARLFELLASLDTIKARTRKPPKSVEDAAPDAGATRGGSPGAADTDGVDGREKKTRWPLIAALLMLLLGAGLLFLLATDTGRQISRTLFGTEPPAAVAIDSGPEVSPDSTQDPALTGDDISTDPAADDVDPGLVDVAPSDATPSDVPPPDVVDTPSPAPFVSTEAELVTPETFDPAVWADVPGLESRQAVGGIEITVLDVIRLANRIALANGYRQMGAPPEEGPNPYWIRTGNQILLPDRRIVTIADGDSLWSLTADYIEQQLERDYPRHRQIVASRRQDRLTDEEFFEEIRTLQEFSNSENFSRMLVQSVQEVSRG